MELIVRFLTSILNFIGFLLEPIIVWWNGIKKEIIPPIKNELLNLSAAELIIKIRKGELKSEELVLAYIERIKEVNPFLNAIIEDRFDEAIRDAKRADKMMETAPVTQKEGLYARYPLLGIPFTVKESCGLKGMSFVVGNIHRTGYKSPDNGDVVQLIRSAGAIPLLVSANPEFCSSWETNTVMNGKCKNPYDTRKSSGGSSGGEGALNAAGASLFGIGSDIAGSIRVPALFNGVFGHKPTGGLLSIKGHFPYSNDKDFGFYLQLGPVTRFAKDLPLLLQIMAGSNAAKLEFNKITYTKDIKIFYMEDNGFTLAHKPVEFDIKLTLLRAVEFFKKNGLQTERASIEGIENAIEMSLAALVTMDDLSAIHKPPKDDEAVEDNVYVELLKYAYGKPKYSFAALIFELFKSFNGFMPQSSTDYWRSEVSVIRKVMLDMLGNDGVFFFPTFHRSATFHNTSVQNIPGVGFVALFNIIGFPATHVPMGLNSDGVPIGFQVVAAPYNDKLCLQIAGELEVAFGGWVPPSKS